MEYWKKTLTFELFFLMVLVGAPITFIIDGQTSRDLHHCSDDHLEPEIPLSDGQIIIRTRPGLTTDLSRIDAPLFLDCSRGSGEMILSDIQSVTIYSFRNEGNEPVSISRCGSVEFLDSKMNKTYMEISSGSISFRNCSANGCSLNLDAWSDSDLINSTFDDTTIRIENPNDLNVHNNTFFDSTLWLITPKYIDISCNSFIGNRSKLRINMSTYFESGRSTRHIYSNIFESCRPGLLFSSINRDFLMWYEIWDNHFRNCSMGIVIEACDGYYNRIWRNTFYHNGGTGDQDTGKQISMLVRYFSEDTFYLNGIGNCWWNCRYPDANDDGIVDRQFDLQADRIYPTGGYIFDKYPLVGDFRTIFSPGLEISYPGNNEMITGPVTVRWETWFKRYNITSLELSINGKYHTDVAGMDWIQLDLDPGSYSISLLATNQVGLKNISRVEFTVIYPGGSLLINEPINGQIFDTPRIHFKWKTPGMENISGIHLSCNGSQFDLDPLSEEAYLELLEGEVHAVLTAYDNRGGMAIAEVQFTIDLTPPEVSILSPENGAVISNHLVYFTWDIYDRNGIGRLRTRLNEGGWKDLDPDAESCSEFLGSGNHIFSLEVSDLAGFIVNESSAFRVGVGGKCIIEPSTDVITNQNMIHFRWRQPENFDTIKADLRIVDPPKTYDVSSISELDVAIVKEGENKVHICFHDKYGNLYEESRSIIFDLESPELEIINKEEFITRDPIIVKWRGMDRIGMDHYRYHLDRQEWSEIIEGNSTTISGLEDGCHEIEVKGVDLAGNEAVAVWSFMVDLTPPALSVEMPVNGSIVKGPMITISWEAFDENGIENVFVFLDGNNTSYRDRGSIELILSSGSHVVAIRAYDKAGHFSELSSCFEVDNNPPVLRWSIDTPEFLNTSNITLKWHGSDDLGICEKRVIVDGELVDLPQGNTAKLHLEEGRRMIRIEIEDRVGRLAFIEWNPLVDLTDPELSSLRYVRERHRVMLYCKFHDNQSGIKAVRLWVLGEMAGQYSGDFTYDLGPVVERDVTVEVRVSDRSGRTSYFTLVIPAEAGGMDEDGARWGLWVAMTGVGILIFASGVGAAVSALLKKRRSIDEKRTALENDFFIQLKAAPCSGRCAPGQLPEGERCTCTRDEPMQNRYLPDGYIKNR
ncbi:MAG: hypothetical protein R6V01_04825 [Thermoplasmatota archaeon]